MSRLIIAMVASLVALTTSVAGQTSTGAVTKTETAGVTAQGTPQLNKNAEDCACESQALPEDLAIVNGVRITRQDIERATQEPVNRLKRQVIQARKQELDLQINSRLLAIEGRRRGINPTKLLEQEVIAKVKEPTQAEAQVFYDQNKTRIQGTFDEARDDILNYLRERRQADEAKKFANGLRQSIETKVEIPNATPPQDKAESARVLATVNGEPITAGDIEDSLRPLVFGVQEQLYLLRKNELELTINDSLLNQEAQKRKITAKALLDAELKPKQITEEEARTFYTENKDRVSGEFDATKDSIIRYMQQIEVRRAERVFVERLRAAASIQTFLVAPEPPVFSIATADQPSKGNATAPVTIVAFTDYQCPACAETHLTLGRLVKEYGARVRLVARDFPLVQHTQAFKAAEAAEAAREQGKYWEYVEVLLRNQSALEMTKLKEYASELKLDRARFDQALASGKFVDTVQRDIQDGLKLGVDSTPTVFVNGRRVADKSYDALKAVIDTALKVPPRKMTSGE
ncbi:MAG TPA: thioredoxin domain-containing protein [Pyrinomonadaceae bacterium]|nr:thioredoxin domain-containing protein [Pyrinomonadaceae bacterium]